MPQIQSWSSSLEKFTMDSFEAAKYVSVGWEGDAPNSQVSAVVVESLTWMSIVQL